MSEQILPPLELNLKAEAAYKQEAAQFDRERTAASKRVDTIQQQMVHRKAEYETALARLQSEYDAAMAQLGSDFDAAILQRDEATVGQEEAEHHANLHRRMVQGICGEMKIPVPELPAVAPPAPDPQISADDPLGLTQIRPDDPRGINAQGVAR